MISVYLQINLFLLMGWIGFSLLPQWKLRARSRKILAQAILLCSLLAVPLSAGLPAESFPHKMSEIAVAGMGDMDAGSHRHGAGEAGPALDRRRRARSPGASEVRPGAAHLAARCRHSRDVRAPVPLVVADGATVAPIDITS